MKKLVILISCLIVNISLATNVLNTVNSNQALNSNQNVSSAQNNIPVINSDSQTSSNNVNYTSNTNNSAVLQALPQTAAPANGVMTVERPYFTLQLNSNPTTGYSWFVVSYPRNLLKVVKHQYVPSTSKLIGAGGTEIWVFQALPAALAAPTVIKVIMMYARPWEINDKSTTQTFYMATN